MSRTKRVDRLSKNLFINGDFDFWQRGTSSTSASIYLADRWLSGSGTTAYDRISGGASDRSKYFARIGGSSGTVILNQRVESNFARQIETDKLILVINAKVNSGASDLEIRVHTPNVVDNYSAISEVFNQNLGALSGTWQKFIYVLDVTPAMRSNGFQMNIGNLAASGAVEIDMSQVGLFEYYGNDNPEFTLAGRNLIEEYTLCQRYFEKTAPSDEGLGSNAGRIGAFARSDGGIFLSYRFDVEKRVSPVMNVHGSPTAGLAFQNVQKTGFEVIGTIAAFSTWVQICSADAEL